MDIHPLTEVPDVAKGVLSHMLSGKDIAAVICTCRFFGAILNDYSGTHLRVQNRLLQQWKSRGPTISQHMLEASLMDSAWMDGGGGHACMAGKMRIGRLS
ncbi:hypothetical protein BSKO_00677 [Bryopsis sp. KO-2023]|nr:hypothetical protein BSKO_00677 [Bryopsis sp. KO-2023]